MEGIIESLETHKIGENVYLEYNNKRQIYLCRIASFYSMDIDPDEFEGVSEDDEIIACSLEIIKVVNNLDNSPLKEHNYIELSSLFGPERITDEEHNVIWEKKTINNDFNNDEYQVKTM